jgi:hypothetical protein
MSVEANTDKPHSHHATLKEIPEDDGLRNKAAPGVSWTPGYIAAPITLRPQAVEDEQPSQKTTQQ